MMEEFILRIGTDARAMVSGLQRAGAYAKAWATTLAEDFTTRIGRMFGAAFVLSKVEEFGRRTLENIREKILAIHRAQEELPGASTNFIQGLMNQVERLGLSFEEISKPLLKFKQTLDAARLNPGGKNAQDLLRYGIITDLAELKTQKFSTSVARLSDAYLRFGKNLQFVSELEGKEAKNPALLAILGLGGNQIEAMERFNPVSDIGQKATNLFTGAFGEKKTAGQVITAVTANLAEWALRTSIFTRQLTKILELKGSVEGVQEVENLKIAESLDMEKSRVEANTKLLELTEKRHELESDIADQGKASVAEMASEARRLTGAQAPRLYGVSKRMSEALKIDTLEKRAHIAYEQGNDALSDQLRKQAQALRASTPWLTDKDKNPMRRTEEQLQVVNEQLKPVKEMADFVNKEHSK